MADAASSSSGRCWKFGVFIKFIGEDTRKIFVGHLYRALEQKAIHTFIDSEELRKGNDLSTLLHAIDDSRLSIVVLSKNYASSTWCLKELVIILECMDAQKQIVVPVFYEVDPSHVRNLRGSFAEAFAKHDHSKAEKEEVSSWKTALFRAANLSESGWDSQDYRDDGELIEKIVKDTLHKLIHVSSSKAHGLVGMDYHLNKMYSLLGLGVDDVRFAGIWGMGGIGKTTIAHAVYDEIAYQFDHCCFLDDVKERFKNKGKTNIQEYLLYRILKEKVPSKGSLNRGSNMIMKSLGKKKVLLVFDDLDDIAQIETILGEHSFGGGSRIILTTMSCYPELVWETDEKNRTIIHVAVLHRHASIFNLVHGIGSIKDLVVTYEDDQGNNIVHMAAKLAPQNQLNLVSGVALQMQRELVWFEVLLLLVPLIYL
ncbi:hypothetical protein M0R45_015649 [Rubus argutus]|uniref:TIR domain-containing protein n=1 Tax=Rubus argutus TaxID=59490 RepID=A0AAW1XSA8_RUBAR